MRPCLALLLMTFALSAQTPPELNTVASVDLDRYLGRWYEIARLPNRFQKDCAGDVTAIYSMQPDGNLEVVNQCRKTDGSSMSATGAQLGA